MSEESKSYKKLEFNDSYKSFRIELLGNREEFQLLTKDFEQSDIHFEGKLAYPPMAMALPPYEIFFSLISTVGDLVAIADILYRYLKNKKNKKEKKISFKFNGKEMTIEGNYSQKEILGIVKEFSKIATSESISAISKSKKKKLQLELKELQDLLQTYTKLVEIGESKENRSPEIKSKLKRYQNKKSEIETRLLTIEQLLKEKLQ